MVVTVRMLGRELGMGLKQCELWRERERKREGSIIYHCVCVCVCV